MFINFSRFNFHVKIFCVKLFLLSSSSSIAVAAALKRCGAFLIVFMTLFTLGLVALSFVDRWLPPPPPPDSTIVASCVVLLLLLLLLRFIDPRRNERDKERDSGLSFFNVDDDPADELGDDSATRFSNSEVTNLSRSAKSLAFGGLLLLDGVDDDDDVAIVLPRTSESYSQQRHERERERKLCQMYGISLIIIIKHTFNMRSSN